jgi:predicted nucleic acid-binding protein
VLDTSVLVAGFGRSSSVTTELRATLAEGEVVRIPSLVLYEWLRGPRSGEEIAAQRGLFPGSLSLAFGAQEASIAATLYSALPRARSREMDIAIAACAIVREAELWTLNPADFRDIPGLKLFSPPSLPSRR